MITLYQTNILSMFLPIILKWLCFHSHPPSEYGSKDKQVETHIFKDFRIVYFVQMISFVISLYVLSI